MYKPNITVAVVVHAEGQFLLVEESIKGQIYWNQPAGHVEQHESILHAAQRELLEETSLALMPQALLAIFQWRAQDGTHFLRFTFVIELAQQLSAVPQDPEIDRCLWLPASTLLQANNLRSPLVRESILCYQRPERYPLTLLQHFIPG